MIRKTAAIALLFSAATVSNAGILTVHSLKPGQFGAVTIEYKGDQLIVNAGTFSADYDGGSRFDAYCVDLDHWISLPSSFAVTKHSTADLANGYRVARAYAANYESVDTVTEGVALQVALWDLVVDNGDGLMSGQFKATANPAVSTMVSSILADSLSGPFLYTDYFKAVTHGPNNNINQNMIGGQPVPEPATLGALAIGLAAVLRRRKKNQP